MTGVQCDGSDLVFAVQNLLRHRARHLIEWFYGHAIAQVDASVPCTHSMEISFHTMLSTEANDWPSIAHALFSH
jgi:hypothetical protein